MPLLKPSTIQLLRFPFSFFLMPVFLFALSLVQHPDWEKTIGAFLLIHFLLYPASNGYNSYMDRDTGSIGGIDHPLPPEKQLYYITIIMDVAGLLLSFWVSPFFAAGYLVYILFSRLYSYRGIRLKKHAIAGYFTVVINQGAHNIFNGFYSGGR